MSEQDVITGQPGEVYWRYEVPKSTAKVLLLTRGRTAMAGQWSGRLGENYIAWAPLPRRDKAIEADLVARGIIPLV